MFSINLGKKKLDDRFKTRGGQKAPDLTDTEETYLDQVGDTAEINGIAGVVDTDMVTTNSIV